MRIHLSPELHRAIGEHGVDAYPHECCGAMLGTSAPEKTVTRLIRLDNARSPENSHNRFLVTDRDYRRVEREAAAADLDLVGFYHSHPDHPARPSQYDLDHAMPWFSYVIVAVAEGRPGEMTSWVLAESRARFEEETIMPKNGSGPDEEGA
jgi:proteasome lid subunit RPN8/RPN11